MECPHCRVNIHESFNWRGVGGNWMVGLMGCPSCEQHIIQLVRNSDLDPVTPYIAFPLQTGGRQPVALDNVPLEIGDDYSEACQVLPISAKASAALARRCLQAVLRDHGYAQHNLIGQIKAVQSETDPKKGVPQALHDTIDAVRHFGNFSAHPMTDNSTLQILPVEPEEAEWCLEIVEEMFDHYYDKPASAKAKKAALDAKLGAAGKPPAL